ncbi:MAG: efflux RND transporter periplasmic adaptor subunit [Planctomycetes bacterium]|nr:efflux RND transporter periplasmic adaptor subunit [Planctomycetota bacterium]
MARTLDLPGTMEAMEQADLYAKVSGYVAEVRVDIGDRVKTGQLLAVLDVPELAKDLQEAKAQQAAKTVSWKAAESAGMKAASAALEQAKRRLEVTRNELERRKSELALKEVTFQRRERLFNEKAVTDQDLDETRCQLQVARAEVKIAESKIAAAEADVQSAEAGHASAEAQVEIAKAQVDLAAAQVDKVQTLLQYTQISAPFDGVITKRWIDKGALVQAATVNRTSPMFAVQRVDAIRTFVDVPETEVSFVVLGIVAKVKPYGLKGASYDGKVTRIAAAINPGTRTMRAEIDLPNADGKLLHGMYAKVLLDLERHANVLAVPTSALLSEGQERFVLVVQDETAVRKPVKVGIEEGGRVEVLEGLSEADQVVVNPKAGVAAGAHVKAAPKKDK